MITCAIVNAQGIIIAKFKCANDRVPGLEHIAFRGRTFVRKHIHGGGEPTFYEIVPDASLNDWDCVDI